MAGCLPVPPMVLLKGTWTNDKKSRMEITEVHDDGKVATSTFSGTYYTGVGSVDAEQAHPMYGQWMRPRDTVFAFMVTFSVMWENTVNQETREPTRRATTAWTGMAYENDGKPCMETKWTLTSEKYKKDFWKATRIGGDSFTKKSA